MNSPRARALLAGLGILVAIGSAAVAIGASADRAAARRGADWLVKAIPTRSGQGVGADTAVALRAAGKLTHRQRVRRSRTLARGARAYATTAGAIGKTILARVALRAPARCVGGVDLLRRLRRTYSDGRYGTTVFDQTLAMLALHAIRSPIPHAASQALAARRGRGGYDFMLDRGRDDEVTSTSMAIMALRVAGVSPRRRPLAGALAWLRRQRAAGGGFGHERRDRSEANASALALIALRSTGHTDRRAARALRRLQRRDGSFALARGTSGSRTLATIDAVTALSGARLPVVRTRSRPRPC